MIEQVVFGDHEADFETACDLAIVVKAAEPQREGQRPVPPRLLELNPIEAEGVVQVSEGMLAPRPRVEPFRADILPKPRTKPESRLSDDQSGIVSRPFPPSTSGRKSARGNCAIMNMSHR